MPSARKSPRMCGRTAADTGAAHPGLDHVCDLDYEHAGRHKCSYCPHRW